MEDYKEFERLEMQANQKQYNIEQELRFLSDQNDSKILDLGCGTGVVSRMLKKLNPSATILGVDASELRINQARKNNLNQDLIFKVHNALEPIGMNQFNTIVCRYVLEHLEEPQSVVDHIYSACNPGGTAYLIDFDGIFLNFHTNNAWFNRCLKKIAYALECDLFIGRKLPNLLKNAGFKQINHHVELVTFEGEDLEQEAINCDLRCKNARPLINSILGENEASRFIKAYPELVREPGNIIFYNKFIAWAKKPALNRA
jgi:ubiquinone/menaquinone biosynthesis C-methylase UbiE